MTFPEIGAGPSSAVANIQKAKKIIFLSVVAEVGWKISLLKKSCLGYPRPEGEGLFSNLTPVHHRKAKETDPTGRAERLQDNQRHGVDLRGGRDHRETFCMGT